MNSTIQKFLLSSMVFSLGMTIGAVYTPEAIALAKLMDETKIEKQQVPGKARHLRLKISKKKRYT